MVFRIRSITKQFRAVNILRLHKDGKLKLGDPITNYLLNYPTQGTTITVRHLIDHTSGIKSYTSLDYHFLSMCTEI